MAFSDVHFSRHEHGHILVKVAPERETKGNHCRGESRGREWGIPAQSELKLI